MFKLTLIYFKSFNRNKITNKNPFPVPFEQVSVDLLQQGETLFSIRAVDSPHTIRDKCINYSSPINDAIYSETGDNRGQ